MQNSHVIHFKDINVNLTTLFHCIHNIIENERNYIIYKFRTCLFIFIMLGSYMEIAKGKIIYCGAD